MIPSLSQPQESLIPCQDSLPQPLCFPDAPNVVLNTDPIFLLLPKPRLEDTLQNPCGSHKVWSTGPQGGG